MDHTEHPKQQNNEFYLPFTTLGTVWKRAEHPEKISQPNLSSYSFQPCAGALTSAGYKPTSQVPDQSFSHQTL